MTKAKRRPHLPVLVDATQLDPADLEVLREYAQAWQQGNTATAVRLERRADAVVDRLRAATVPPRLTAAAVDALYRDVAPALDRLRTAAKAYTAWARRVAAGTARMDEAKREQLFGAMMAATHEFNAAGRYLIATGQAWVLFTMPDEFRHGRMGN
jgi:hypothetical protein